MPSAPGASLRMARWAPTNSTRTSPRNGPMLAGQRRGAARAWPGRRRRRRWPRPSSSSPSSAVAAEALDQRRRAPSVGEEPAGSTGARGVRSRRRRASMVDGHLAVVGSVGAGAGPAVVVVGGGSWCAGGRRLVVVPAGRRRSARVLTQARRPGEGVELRLGRHGGASPAVRSSTATPEVSSSVGSKIRKPPGCALEDLDLAALAR